MKIITNKKIRSFLQPKVNVFVICNDNIFLSEFMKNFSLSIPHTISQFRDGESFLEGFNSQKDFHKKFSIVVSDYKYENFDQLVIMNGVDTYFKAVEENPELTYILLCKKRHLSNLPKYPNFIPVLKNSNSYIRVQNFIYPFYNEQNTITQRLINKYIFMILGVVISVITTILILVWLLKV